VEFTRGAVGATGFAAGTEEATLGAAAGTEAGVDVCEIFVGAAEVAGAGFVIFVFELVCAGFGVVTAGSGTFEDCVLGFASFRHI
jgi:tryptophan synthase beta subunit